MQYQKQTIINFFFIIHSTKNVRPIIKRFEPIIGRIKRSCKATYEKNMSVAIKACLKMDY